MNLSTSYLENTSAALKAHHILSKLVEQGAKSRWVGGCVRDRLLAKNPQDYDLATVWLPERVLKYFRSLGSDYEAYPTGLDYGTITVIYQGQSVEITTLRQDVTTDGRHAQVRYGTSFEADAQRRDFTINALSQDLEGKIYDYHQGIRDLQNRWIKFVGEPRKRIREDYLRILRFFRFALALNFQADPQALEIITEEVSGLKVLSQERIFTEHKKIFSLLGSPQRSPEIQSTLLSQWLQTGVFTTCHPIWQNSLKDPQILKKNRFKDLHSFCLQLTHAYKNIIHPLNPHLPHLKWVVLIKTFCQSSSEEVLQTYQNLRSSRKEAQEAFLWHKALAKSYRKENQDEAFATLEKLEKIRPLEPLSQIEKALQGYTLQHPNPPSSQPLNELLSDHLKHLKSLLFLELHGRSLRTAPPLLSSNDFMHQLGYRGKKIGAAQRHLKKLQWQEKITDPKQALKYFQTTPPTHWNSES